MEESSKPKVGPSLAETAKLLAETSVILVKGNGDKGRCPECGKASKLEFNSFTQESVHLRCDTCAEAVQALLVETFGPKKLLLPIDELKLRHEREDDTEWIWGQLAAPGYLTRVDGRPKVAGKSTLLFALCAAIRGGKEFLGFPTRQVPVAYCSEQRWKALNAKLITPYGAPDYMHLFYDEPMDLGSLCGRLREEVEELGVQLIILDTASKWMKLVAGGRQDADIMSQQMGYLEDLAQDVGVIVADYTKKGESAEGEATLGATEQVGRADILIELKKPDASHENVRRMQIVGRSDAPDLIEYEMKEDGVLSPCDLSEIRSGDKKERVYEVLLELEAGGGQAPSGKAIVSHSEMRRDDVYSALNELAYEGRAGTLGRGPAQCWFSKGTNETDGTGGTDP